MLIPDATNLIVDAIKGITSKGVQGDPGLNSNGFLLESNTLITPLNLLMGGFVTLIPSPGLHKAIIPLSISIEYLPGTNLYNFIQTVNNICTVPGGNVVICVSNELYSNSNNNDVYFSTYVTYDSALPVQLDVISWFGYNSIKVAPGDRLEYQITNMLTGGNGYARIKVIYRIIDTL